MRVALAPFLSVLLQRGSWTAARTDDRALEAEPPCGKRSSQSKESLLKLSFRLGLLATLLSPLAASAAPMQPPFPTTEISQYLLIGMGPVNDGQATIGLGANPGVGQAQNTNNFELGANKAPVPSTSDFLDSGGGPGLAGNVPPLPSNAREVGTGITGDGNIAVTHVDGVFNLQDVGVYADRGIQCAQDKGSCDAGTQNSFFNDPEQFPNTYDPVTETGTQINPGDADQATRIDKPNQAGGTGAVDFTVLNSEIAAAKSTIPLLTQTDVFSLSMDGGVLSSDFTYNAPSGLSVVDIETGNGNDFLLENATLVIDGPADSFVIFRLPDGTNLNISNGSILVGDGGIGLNNVLFVSDNPDNDQHFNFDNTILNGVAFWSLGMQGGEININNAQGCTQLISDKITLNNVRFSRCGVTAPIPEPNSYVLFFVGLGIVGTAIRRRKS